MKELSPADLAMQVRFNNKVAEWNRDYARAEAQFDRLRAEYQAKMDFWDNYLRELEDED